MDTAKDGGPGWNDKRGVSGVPFTSADASGAAAAVTDAPQTNRRLVITDLIVAVGSDMDVTFTEQTSGTKVYPKLFLKAGAVVNLVTRGKMKLKTAGKKLMVQTSASGNIDVLAIYTDEP